MDSKGRVVLPAKFRDRLADGCVLTKGQDRCLYVFPLDRWEEEMERVNRLPRTDRRARNFARSFFAGADDQRPDRQGRISLPQPLRDYAALEKEVMVVGAADRVEIWDAGTWDRFSREADEYYADIEEAMSEYGI
ncbi:MAG: division/cell wall cluster transcriptional repressor MraZ [Actinomycetota bacterium]|nr:division/cell wall cluster transcriptional repressor MraZ [Actinomycetota bacterium]